MLEKPQITQTSNQLTALIRLTIPRSEMRSVMGPGVRELMAAVGRVKPGIWPATKVARTVYRGDYGGLGEAWGEFNDWIAAQGHRPGPDYWECYATGPESTPDAAAWRTELTRPLIG